MITDMILQIVQNQAVRKSAEEFGKIDPNGFGLTVIAMGVVFSSLILLYIIFRTLGKSLSGEYKRKSLVKKGRDEEASQIPEYLPGEVAAAISMALHLYSAQLHDQENTVLTIKRVSRIYSPWSSKIYGIQQFQR